MRTVVGIAVAIALGVAVGPVLAGCSNTNSSPQFPATPPPNPSGEPPNEAVGPEAAGAPMGPVEPESTPKSPDPGPTVIGNPPGRPPAPPIVTDALPIDPARPLPAESLGTNTTLVLDQPASVLIDGRADLFSAGRSRPDPARGGVAPSYLVLARPGGMVRIRSVRGKTACDAAPPSGPDDHGCAGLLGVFLGERGAVVRRGGEPVGRPREAELSPALGEAFFIGDGLTGTGTGEIQDFEIPNGATKLYLGYAQSSYARNTGGLSAVATQHAR